MSIKKLFESGQTKNYAAGTNQKEKFGEIESAENAEQIVIDQERFVPYVDYSDPQNFVTFGSARLYYESAMSRITDFYPYDGSDKERNNFLNKSLDIEKYILTYKYPRTTGYITLARDGYTVSAITDGYGVPESAEYIDLKGGPGTGSATSLTLKDLMPNPYSSKNNHSNIYDENIYESAGLPSNFGKGTRQSNLRANFDNGVTLEFWLKTGSISQTGASAKGARQVIFDSWNNEAVTDADYGRITVELTGTTDAAGTKQNPFVVTVQSGAYPPRTVDTMKVLGTDSLHEDMGDWNHYALRLYNTGSDKEILKSELYVNGKFNDSSSWSPYALSHSLETTPTSSVAWNLSDTQYRYNSQKNLQGWWKLEDAAGEYVVDHSGHGRTGSYASSSFKPVMETQFYPGLYIQSASAGFGANTATTTGINIGDATLWNGIIGNAQTASNHAKFTIGAWVRKVGDGGNTIGRIFDFGYGDLVLYTNSAERIYFGTKWKTSASGSGAVYFQTDEDAFPLNDWAHIAVTYDTGHSQHAGSLIDGGYAMPFLSGNLPKIYVDGVEQSVEIAQGKPTGSWYGIGIQNCIIGNRSKRDRVFSGSIADFAIWDTILTQEEVQAIATARSYTQKFTKITELNSNKMVARIGALVTTPASSSAAAGSGRLSASLDEFRYWKTARTSKEIGRHWFTQVYGGANTDVSNADLGVYYKFNEGVTGDSATDSVVLDYAGRATNGFWTGYSSNSRNTGSAMVSASAVTSEYHDPIIRTNHPDVINLKSELIDSGSSYDYNNNASMISMVPGWIQDEEAENENSDLRYIAHIMGAYFDKLKLQIAEIPKLRQINYPSASFKPYPLAEHLPQSLGLYIPELFVDSTIIEKFLNRNEDTKFENSLTDTKNLIYQNLYNNLAQIYKSKGTEKSIRNVLSCFNVDDKTLSIQINSNNQEYELRNNLQQQILSKNFINFNTVNNSKAIVYQRSASLAGLDNIDVSGSIQGNETQEAYGLTYEGNFLFPDYNNQRSTFVRDSNYDKVSLFGFVHVDTGTGTDASVSDKEKGVATNTEIQDDRATLKIYAVRDAVASKNAYFQLTGAFTTASNGFSLTSSTFFDVYDDEQWNLSVRIKPKKYPYAPFVSGSGDSTYEIIFSGYNPQTVGHYDSFSISHDVTGNIAKQIIRARKRPYVGADRTNLTGAVQYRSDVYASSVAFWTKYLNDDDLIQHAFDFENIGISASYRPISALDTGNRGSDIKNINTLALNWNFGNVTGSDSGGNFVVQDFSSGSQENREKFGWVGKISGYQNTGYGYGFTASDTDVMNKKRINIYKFTNPEIVVSSDLVQTFSDEDMLFPNLKRTEIAPNYVYSLEKSLYGAISEEMLNFFAGAADFHTLIGQPVNRYRNRYKAMEKLRETFFRRVKEVATVEKYINYYKWFDDAITSVISQMVPVSSEFISDIGNIIESHVLERNKYQSKLNIIDSDQFWRDYEPVIEPMGEPPDGLDDTPIPAPPASPQPQNRAAGWWKKRAISEQAEITSGNASVDAQRDNFKKVIWSTPAFSSSHTPKLQTLDGTRYEYPSYGTRNSAGVTTMTIDTEETTTKRNDIKGGTNFKAGKNFEFSAVSLRPAGPVEKGSAVFVPANVLIAFTSESNPLTEFINESWPDNYIRKRNKIFRVQAGRDWEDGIGYKNMKSTIALPFNIFSSSVELSSGYNVQILDKVGRNLQITNLHNDVYGDQLEIPMQGPFSYDTVGGHQSRHIGLNDGTDSPETRAEAWRILLGTCDIVPHGAIGMVGPDYPPPDLTINRDLPFRPPYPYDRHQKAYLYRDFIAKRPVNIKNISRQSGSTTVPGNYQNQYEIIHSFGATNNPRAFIENQPTLPPQLDNVSHTTNVMTFLERHRGSEGHFQFVDEYNTGYLTGATNKSIIITRFAAVGGPEVETLGYQDFKASEYSPYNVLTYRNLSVQKPSQGPSGSTSEPHGGTPTTSRVFDIHGKDYGLYSHAARHTGKFGRDSVFQGAEGASYDQLPGFHKVHRNRSYRMEIGADSTDFVTRSVYDNLNVSRPIPCSDRQYLWLSSSVIDVGKIRYADYQNTTNVSRMRWKTSAGLIPYWTFVSSSDAFTGSFHQPINRLNIIVLDPVDDDNGLMGNSDGTVELNEDLVGAARPAVSPDYLNQLLCKRGSKYGWGWNKFRQQDHQLLLKQRKENELVIRKDATDTLTKYNLPPISMRGRTSLVNMSHQVIDITTPGSDAVSQDITFKITNTNEKIFFSQKDMNDVANIDIAQVYNPLKSVIGYGARNSSVELNWILYSQNIFPSLRNEFISGTDRPNFDNMYWRDDVNDRVALTVDPRGTAYRSSNVAAANSFGIYVSQSAWCLDAMPSFLTRSGLEVAPNAKETTSSLPAGELQNSYFRWARIPPYGQPGALYARMHSLDTPRSVAAPSGPRIAETGSLPGLSASFEYAHRLNQFGAGEALWEAGAQAGFVEFVISKRPNKPGSAIPKIFTSASSQPWWDTYESFKEDLKLKAKGYAVIPEFRISEHVDSYRKLGTATNRWSGIPMLSIPGARSSSIDDPLNDNSGNNFYKDYSNSDFLEGFLGVQKDSLLEAKEIRMTCTGAIRYNAYKGFYPAQRTLDLVSQFSKSFYSQLIVSQSNAAAGPKFLYGKDSSLDEFGGCLKQVFDPVFSPGILFNSIKSGIAVDYPVVHDGTKIKLAHYGKTTDDNNFALSITGALGVDSHSGTSKFKIGLSGGIGYTGGQFWDRRIPFEAIIRPRDFLPGYTFLNMEAHPSASVVTHGYEVTASLSNGGDNLYNLMARNFFGESATFFLDDSELTTLESNTVTDDLMFPAGEVYMSRIKLRRSHNGARTYEYEHDSFTKKNEGTGGDIGTGNLGLVGINSGYGNYGCRAYISSSRKDSSFPGSPAGNNVLLQAEFPIPQDPKMNPDFKETFTMYSRPSAFGPPVAGRPTGSHSTREITYGVSGHKLDGKYTASFEKAAFDSFEGINPAFTPPYTNGEAWVDLVFRPSASISYDLERILAETETVCWRFDSGPKIRLSGSTAFTANLPEPGFPLLIPVQQRVGTSAGTINDESPNDDNTVPSPYDGLRINVNSMQITSSLDIFGVERVLEETSAGLVTNKSVGQKWLIRPKWETPMMNFNDEGVHPITAHASTLTIPTFASASVPRGMWHQFGVIPEDPDVGVFMEISEIPLQWLTNHYEVINEPSVYNNFSIDNARALPKKVKSLAKLCGFNKNNNTKRLGELKESLKVREAIVAVPYITKALNSKSAESKQTRGAKGAAIKESLKQFISIPKRRWKAAFKESQGTSVQADLLKTSGASIRKLRQAMERYVFPPQFDCINNPNITPVAMYVFEFEYEFDKDDLSYMWQNIAPRNYKKLSFQTQTVTHNLADNELINKKILSNENLRWMVFKVKQRATSDYYDLLVDQAGAATTQIGAKKKKNRKYNVGYNWPYDYLSFVELIKMDVDILLKNEE